MEKQPSVSLLKAHPIELKLLHVAELSIKLHTPPDEVGEIPKEAFKILHGYSDYDDQNKGFTAGIILEIGKGMSESEVPFHLKIEIVGIFSVDEQNFDLKYVEDWAQKNAHFILMPYLREQVYSLSSRCGLSPIILPLVQVPTFEIRRPVEKATAKKAKSKKVTKKIPTPPKK